MRKCCFFASILVLFFSNTSADAASDSCIWAEESLNGWSLSLGGNPAADKIVQGMKDGLEGKLKPGDWPHMLRVKPTVYVLTPDGIEKTTITGVEITPVGSLQINTELYHKSQSSQKMADAPQKGLAQIGKAFTTGAKLRNLVDKNSLPLKMAAVPKKIHLIVKEILKKEKATLEKELQVKIKIEDVEPEDYSFVQFSSSRGKVWLAWISNARFRERVEKMRFSHKKYTGPIVTEEEVVMWQPVFAAVLDAEGSVLEMLRGPKWVNPDGDSSESWTPVLAVDFTGSGSEEILAEVPYYEGFRVFRYSLKAGKGVIESTLLSDGS